jgi:hypothetical protein
VASLGEIRSHLFLKRKAGVVGGDDEFHCDPFGDASRRVYARLAELIFTS